jgi:hypothetical protein
VIAHEFARRVAAVGLTAALIGCAQRSDAPPRVETPAQTPTGDSTGAALLGAFAGVLPCADCSGIRSELRLYTEQPSGRPTCYEVTETYLGARDGDRTVRRAGRWTILRGSATDPDATVYQLDYDRADGQQNSLRVSDAELRLLDRDQREITSSAPHSLHRVPNDQNDVALLGKAEARFSVGLSGPNATARRQREREEVSAQPLCRRSRHVAGVKEPTELLTGAQDLPPARPPPPRVRRGQVEQLEGSRLRVFPPRRIAGVMGANRPLHLAAHIRELFDELQLRPACGRACVHDRVRVRHRAPVT